MRGPLSLGRNAKRIAVLVLAVATGIPALLPVSGAAGTGRTAGWRIAAASGSRRFFRAGDGCGAMPARQQRDIEQALDAGEHLGTRERLLHEIIGADTLCIELLGRLFVAAHHDDRDVARGRLPAQQAQRRETAHARQHDV